MTTMIMNTTVQHVLPLFVGLLAKSTLLLLLAALACRLLRRSSAATRHLVWTAALISILILPLVSATMPKWDVAWGRAVISSPVDSPATLNSAAAESTPHSVSTSSPADTHAVPSDIPTSAPLRSFSVSHVWAVAGLASWLLGTFVSLAYLAVGLNRIGRIGRRAIPLEGEALQAAEAARQQIGLRRRVQFLRADDSSAVVVPITWGVFRPVVLLPKQSCDWSEGCLWAALLHEMAHIQRLDWPTQLLARLACALYWWHPLVWWSARQARAESERAADDCVLHAGMKPADYAQRLVEVVRSMPVGASSATVAIGMVQPSEVEGRLRAVLASGRNRKTLTRRRMACTLLTSSILLFGVSAIQVVTLAANTDANGVAVKVPVAVPFKGHPIIVLDAGHGGKDTGGIGLNRVMEKDLALSIAQQLRTELERRGAVVYMTRTDDSFPSLMDRPHFAAVHHADYFVSVHCELSRAMPQSIKADGQGTQVYFHGNDAKCHRLAKNISQQIGRNIDLSPNRVLSDTTRFVQGFAVLRGASMPAVLVECGCLDNAHDLERLRNRQGQQRIAEGIAQGLITFQAQE